MDFINTKSHMPFLTADLTGRRMMFFCLAGENNVWKLHFASGHGEPQRLETGLASEMIECSSCAWQDETGWHVSFIAGGVAHDPVYHLYRMDGETLGNLSQPIAIRPTRAGFVFRDRLVTAELFDRFTVHDQNMDRTIAMPGMYIYRVAYRGDNPDKLLVSGAWINESDSLFTVEYDLKTGVQHLIHCDSKSAYKCTICGDEVWDTIQTGDHFEQRQIRQASCVNLTPCHLLQVEPDDDMVTPKARSCRCKKSLSQNLEPASRPGCLECVEKHLGAAMVQLSEIHAGYQYHLRLIGHLHEAEEESQPWDALFQMIRRARKNYQTDRIVPDWDSIARELANLKEVSHEN